MMIIVRNERENVKDGECSRNKRSEECVRNKSKEGEEIGYKRN